MPALVPAIYDGDEMTAFREWLPASAAGSIGGSFAAADIRDYYVSPYDLGYGRVVAFDHDFYGRDGLAARSTGPSRQKVTLIWDETDVQRAIGASLRAEGPPAKYLELPKARYATHQYDRILVGDDLVGISSDCGYIANERCFVSLALIDAGSGRARHRGRRRVGRGTELGEARRWSRTAGGDPGAGGAGAAAHLRPHDLPVGVTVAGRPGQLGARRPGPSPRPSGVRPSSPP